MARPVRNVTGRTLQCCRSFQDSTELQNSSLHIYALAQLPGRVTTKNRQLPGQLIGCKPGNLT